jgi:hypothetical protein
VLPCAVEKIALRLHENERCYDQGQSIKHLFYVRLKKYDVRAKLIEYGKVEKREGMESEKSNNNSDTSASSASSLPSSEKVKRKRGAPKGSRNAAKPGEDLRLELHFSKPRRFFLAQWYEQQYGYKPSDDELREVARRMALTAIDNIVWEDYHRRHPNGTGGEVF